MCVKGSVVLGTCIVYRVREEVAATLTPSFIIALTPDTNSSQSGARLCLGKQGKGRAEQRDCFLWGREAHRLPALCLLSTAVRASAHHSGSMELNWSWDQE